MTDDSIGSQFHRQALKAAQEGRLDEAQSALDKAIQANPDNPVFRIHLANVLKEKKLFAQAKVQLQAVIEFNPTSAVAYNNLGTVLYAEGDYQESIKAYQHAIDLQSNYADAYYNLGLALIKHQKGDAAMATFSALLELVPDHVGAHFQLGCLWMGREKFQSAREAFTWIEKRYPFHAETLTNLGACYLKLGFLNEAKSYYLRVHDLSPKDCQVLYNLGVISMQQGLTKEAIDYYAKAIAINPDYYEAHNNISVAYLHLKDYESAKKHYSDVLRILPHNEAVKHTIDILNQNQTISGSPPEYIRVLFDSYADHYDSHLSEGLHYQVPRLLYELVLRYPAGKADILDIGCGTGLTGALFKPLAKTLTGVDLSEKMLSVARAKQLYDTLVASEVVAYLNEHRAAYDLVVAGDVANYFGDLAGLFGGVAHSLRENGRFVFNTEVSEDKPYYMTESGRFAHSLVYIETVANDHGFSVVASEEAVIRTQNEQPVMGRLYLLSC